jgi:hypothetical protein
MQKWEYVAFQGSETNSDDITKFLNIQGKESWELVSTLPKMEFEKYAGTNKKLEIIYVFKRPKP